MYFFVRTQNPRPTFHLDMTREERSVMERHTAYWSEKAEQGLAVVFGPVADPAGYYGIGVYRVDGEEQMRALLRDDPANGLLAYEWYEMPRAVLGRAPLASEVTTRLRQVVLRLLAAVMESRLRYRWFGPDATLAGAGVGRGQTVLEIGCGTGFFTVPAARMIGGDGRLIAMDKLPESVAAVAAKVRAAGLDNVDVVEGDALETKLDDESVDTVLIFGVIPAPMLPLDRLLAEMRRILRPGGMMAVWPPSWVHRTIARSPLFGYDGMRRGVLRYRRAGVKP